ncbi:MAG: hypothetical protein RLZZ453_1152 [Chlamydiota bacterium]|jgi:hypothetical protein
MNQLARLQAGPDIATRLMQVPSIITSSLTLDVGDYELARKLRLIFPNLQVQNLAVLKQFEDYPSKWERDQWVQNPLTHTVLPVFSLNKDLLLDTGKFDVRLYPSIGLVNYIDVADIKGPVLQNAEGYVEGGNVFYCLLNKKGRLEDRLAVIIGITTVLWTRAHLESVGYFTMPVLHKEKRFMRKKKIPDYDDPVRMAKWRLSLRAIAKHLGVCLQNVICLEHNLALDSRALCLHIDLNIALGPNNKVFVHSPKLAQDELMKVDPRGIRYAKKELLEADQQITERNSNTLKQYGFDVIPIAGYYGSLTDNPLEETYFLNGLFFEHEGRKIFVTAAAQHGIGEEPFTPFVRHLHLLSEAFSKAMAAHNIYVVYINLIAHLEGLGGVHCLINERRVCTLFPLSVIPVESVIEKIPTLVVFCLSKKVKDTVQSLSLFLDDQDFYKVGTQMLKAGNGSLVLPMGIPLQGAKLSFRTDSGLAGSVQLLPGHPREILIDYI